MLDTQVRTCRVCGCDERHACPDGCEWVEADLCSLCQRGPHDWTALTIFLAVVAFSAGVFVGLGR